jgi:hypothetical protein
MKKERQQLDEKGVLNEIIKKERGLKNVGKHANGKFMATVSCVAAVEQRL